MDLLGNFFEWFDSHCGLQADPAGQDRADRDSLLGLTFSLARRYVVNAELKPRVFWSAQAKAELEALVPDAAVRDQIRQHAKATLHHVTACTAHEGAEDGLMWRRAITHEQAQQIKAGWLPEADDDGAQAWDYFLFYRALDLAGFEVVAVRSTRQLASREALYRRIFGDLIGSAGASEERAADEQVPLVPDVGWLPGTAGC